MEGVLKEMGQCGRFQICHVTLVYLNRAFNAFILSLMTFGLYNPGWRCVQDHLTTPSGSVNASNFSSLANVSLLRVGTDRNETNSYDGTCDIIKSCAAIEFNPSSSTVVSEFGLVCDKVWIGYIIVSILYIGMLPGSLVWGRIGERYGRKASLYGSNLMMTVSSGLAIFSPSWEVYAVFTFFMGAGSIGVAVSISPLCMEYLNTKWRPRLSSIPTYNLSALCFALAVFLLRDWKYVHLTSVLVGVVSLLGVFWTPESLRWLVLHGKTSRAEKVVRKVSELNKRPVPKETFGKLIEEKEDTECRHYTYSDLFGNREMLIITLKLSFIAFTQALVYDCVGFGIQSLPGDFYMNIVLASLIGVPGTLSVGLLASRLGRRWAGIVYTASGTLCCAIIITSLFALDAFQIQDILITFSAFINKSVIQAIADLLLTYAAELVPTAIRNLTFSVFFALGRSAGIVGPYLLPRDFPSMVACFAVLMVMQFIAVCVFFSLPETKNKTMMDALEKSEGNAEEDDKC